MGVILFFVLCFWGVTKLTTGRLYLHEHNKWYKEYSKKFDKDMRATHRRLAKEGDYAINAFGMIDQLHYSDGSCKYVPLKNGGDGNRLAEKGKYFRD